MKNIEAEFHKLIKPFLSKRQQGKVMGAFREVLGIAGGDYNTRHTVMVLTHDAKSSYAEAFETLQRHGQQHPGPITMEDDWGTPIPGEKEYDEMFLLSQEKGFIAVALNRAFRNMMLKGLDMSIMGCCLDGYED